MEPVAIIIPERGRILIDPAIPDRDQSLTRGTSGAKQSCAPLSSEAGAQSLAEAEILRDQRRDFEATAKATRTGAEAARTT